MLDWANPERTDEDILSNLLAEATDFDSCWRATSELGGRWVLIFRDGTSSRLFHDSAGQRQVCYTTGDNVWCASQPGLLEEHAGIRPDAEAVAFIRWHGERVPEFWWPGDRLAFPEARVLLPNHALELESGRVFRYWPDAALSHLSGDEAVERISARLRGVIAATVNRFDTGLGLTAGWDSRVLLAAARPFLSELSVYNGRDPSTPKDDPDIVIPDRLAQQFGFELELIVGKEETDEAFAEQFRQSSWLTHPHFADGMQADFEYSRRQKVAVIGNVSEVGKLPYRGKVAADQQIDGQLLAEFYWDGHDWAANALADWIDGLSDTKGINLLDLFYWEQRLGRWLAANCVEFDFAWRDVVAPFNIRGLMIDLLATDEDLRAPPKRELYRALIASQWPELLREPVNPVPRPPLTQRLKSIVRRALRVVTSAKARR